uniref:Sm domain-containing protein n=1 Tax=Syphacia muris TaxID=451379 RepID=A0A0N5A7M0_9BILA
MDLETKQSTKTLVCLLQSMVGKVVTVELRNLVVIRGVLNNCDSFMNVELVKAEVRKLRAPNVKQRVCYEFFHIASRQIRFVHFDNHFDVIGTLETAIRKSRRKKPVCNH